MREFEIVRGKMIVSVALLDIYWENCCKILLYIFKADWSRNDCKFSIVGYIYWENCCKILLYIFKAYWRSHSCSRQLGGVLCGTVPCTSQPFIARMYDLYFITLLYPSCSLPHVMRKNLNRRSKQWTVDMCTALSTPRSRTCFM